MLINSNKNKEVKSAMKKALVIFVLIFLIVVITTPVFAHPHGNPPGQNKGEVGGGNPHGEPPGQVDREHPRGAPPGQAKKNTIYTYSGTFVLVKDRVGDGFSGELRDYNSYTEEYEHYSYWEGTRDTQTTDLNGTTFWIGDWTVREFYEGFSSPEYDSRIYLNIAEDNNIITGNFYYDNDALTYQDSTFTVTEILYTGNDAIRLEGDWDINFSLSTKSSRKAK